MTLAVDSRFPWLLIVFGALVLEGAALYFQYGLKLDPCVMCVYQRAALFGVAAGGLIGALAPRITALRLLGYAVFGAAAAVGLDLALEHVAIQSGASMNCAFLADFPSWARLDEWLPALFMPTGSCDEVDWHFLGYSMPQWMVVVFGGYLVALAYAVAREFVRLRRRV
jgi:disulfide bond formation protein DsbB